MVNTKNGVTATVTTTNRSGYRKRKTRKPNITGQVKVSFMDDTGIKRTFLLPEKQLFIQMDNRSASLHLGARSPKLTVFQPKSMSTFARETIAV